MRFFSCSLLSSPFLTLFILFILLSSPQFAQEPPIGQFELKDASVEREIYPYGWMQYANDYFAVGYRPSVKLSENEFAYLWKPELGARDRYLTAFDLLMEKKWETSFRLEIEENIFALYKEGEEIIALSYFYESKGGRHYINARSFAFQDGSLKKNRMLYSMPGRASQVIGYDFSADSSKIAIYHFLDDEDGNKVRNLLEYPSGDVGGGFKVSNTRRVAFCLYNRALDSLQHGIIPLESSIRQKSSVIDGQIDDQGTLYFSVFTHIHRKKPGRLEIIAYDPKTQERKALAFNRFPHPFREAPYGSMLPPYVGSQGKAYLAYAGRQRLRGRDYTRYFQVVCFDFQASRIDTSRHLNITSTFQVQLGKNREEAGLKPEIIFDKYLMREMIEMEDGSLWLIAQKYERGTRPKRLNARNVQFEDILVSTTEEILLFEFRPDGRPLKAIIVPMIQQAMLPLERLGRFYSSHLNREEMTLHLITREYSGERCTRPPRIFYRKLDLQAGTYTDRQQIFDGKRMSQYFLRGHTLFLNEKLAVLTIVDGDMEERPEIVTLKLGE
jgi:hypothetical protein